MEFNEIVSILLAFLASMGGAAAIIIAVSKWIGQIWADRQSEQFKNQLEISRSILLRYTGEQFSLYNKLWHSLHELKKSGDALWNIANRGNLQSFSNQLRKTSDEIEKNYLLLEEKHYDELMEILNALKKYDFGKKRLIELRQQNIEDIDDYQINTLIQNNENLKAQYDKLLNQLRDDFRKQIRGENIQHR